MTVSQQTAAPAASARPERDAAGVRGLIFLRDRGILVLWALLIAGFATWAYPFFGTLSNAGLVANAAALTAIFAAGSPWGSSAGRWTCPSPASRPWPA